MKILLIGGTSSLALALKPLLAEFAEVLTAGRSGCDVRLDLADPGAPISIASGFDSIINCAAQFGGKRPEEMIATENVNVLGALRLCQACTQAKVGQFVQVSSIFASLDRKSPYFSMYALSKKHADEATQLYAATCGLPLLTIRPAQMYGVGEAYRKNQPFLYAIMDKAQKNQDILIYGSNDALRNFIHVEDVAKAISMAVQRKLVGSYDCVYPENVSYSQIARAAIAAFGSSSRVSFAPKEPDIPNNAFESDDALYHAIAYVPQISIVAGMLKEAAHRKIRS